AGVHVVMIFDTWGGMLDTPSYQTFALHYIKMIVEQLMRENAHLRVPVILFTKGGGKWLNLMQETGCDVFGIDWTMDLSEARRAVGERFALQGNMNPAILYQSPDIIEAEVLRVLSAYGSGSGHIFNLGHGIPEDVNPEHVA